MKFIKKNWTTILQVALISIGLSMMLYRMHHDYEKKSAFWLASQIACFGVLLGVFLSRLLDALGNKEAESTIYDNSQMD